ncbi:MAG: hypothetical protein QE263_07375 [Vampirovibrionales bacterium]|nr:hypothetical protein [Vampirovibrionales bacterium]
MMPSGFWDPLISPWWRSWGILYRATCQVFSTPVDIALSYQSVTPCIQAVVPPALPMGFTRVRVRIVPASWPKLRVLGGAASPSLNDSNIHRLSMAIPTPRLLNGVGASSFSVQALSVPLGEALLLSLKTIPCGESWRYAPLSAPLLVHPQNHPIPMVVLKTTGKALGVPAFKAPKALGLSIPKSARARLASASLAFKRRATDNLKHVLRLAVIRSPLPAHRFKVEQRHEFRNQLALRVAEVPPEKILIRYVVDRIPTDGVARFTPREDGTLSWTWAESQPSHPKNPRNSQDPLIKAACGGWVVVGQRLDTRSPVMTVVMPS